MAGCAETVFGDYTVKEIAVWSFELCDRTAIFMMCTTLREDFGTILFCSFYFDKDMLASMYKGKYAVFPLVHRRYTIFKALFS